MRVNIKQKLKLLLLVFALFTTQLSAVAEPTHASKTTNFAPSMGMGLNGISDWSTQLPFIDLMKQAREWKDWSNKNSALPIHTDEHDWITKLEPEQELGTVFIASSGSPIYKSYVVMYEGNGEIEYRWSVRKNIDRSSQGKDYISLGNNTALLVVTKTNPENPIRNIRIIAEPHLEAFQNGQVFNPDWLAKIGQFRALRFMDWMKTNNSIPFNWQERPKLDDRTWRTRGVPLEVISLLSNQLKSIPWINIPHWAPPSFVSQMAEVFKNTLNPSLPLYLEHSNEVWNWQFKQAQYALQQGKRLWEKEGDAYMQWHGMRTAQICDAFKNGAFKKDSERVICTLGVHSGWKGLEKASLLCPLWDQSPCFKHGFDALAVTTYFNAGLNGPNRKVKDEDKKAHKLATQELISMATSPDRIKTAFIQINQGTALTTPKKKKPYLGLKPFIQEQAQYWGSSAKKYGLDLVAYEGGQHITANGKKLRDNEDVIDFHIEINRAPMMEDAYHTLLKEWKANGGGLHMHFVDIAKPSKWGSWGALEDVLQESSPKWNALTEFNVNNPCWWELCQKFPLTKQLPSKAQQ